MRIRAVDDTIEPEEYYENYPIVEASGLPRLDAFGHWVTKFLATKPLFVRKEAAIGPCLNNEKVSDLDDLVKATKEGLSLSEVEKGQYQLLQPKPDLNLTSEEEAGLGLEQDTLCKKWKDQSKPAQDLTDAATNAVRECDDKLKTETEAGRILHIAKICTYRRQILALAKDKKFECASRCPSPSQALGRTTALSQVSAQYAEVEKGRRVRKEATLFLRSPEGILYYLGELMRVEAQRGFIPEICIEGKLEPLFVAFENTTQHP